MGKNGKAATVGVPAASIAIEQVSDRLDRENSPSPLCRQTWRRLVASALLLASPFRRPGIACGVYTHAGRDDPKITSAARRPEELFSHPKFRARIFDATSHRHGSIGAADEWEWMLHDAMRDLGEVAS